MDTQTDYTDIYQKCFGVFKLFNVTPVQDLRFGRKTLKAGDSFYVHAPAHYESPFDNDAKQLKLKLEEMGFDYNRGNCSNSDFYVVAKNCQRKHFKETLRPIYIAFGGDEAYYDFFYSQYDDFYDGVKFEDYASEKSFRVVFNTIRWYIYYKKIGHCEDWCLMALSYNYPRLWTQETGWDHDWPKKYVDKEITSENDNECLQLCMDTFPDKHEYHL